MSVKNHINHIFDPIICELCGSPANGFHKKGIILCYKCNDKYRMVPDHIPDTQWERYRIAFKKKRREAKGVTHDKRME